MVELAPMSPCAGLLPLSYGPLHLSEVDMGPLTSLAPFRDEQKRVSDTLKAAHGVSYPAPNQTDRAGEVRTLWYGRDMALLAGVPPDPRLADCAALTDQTDAWAAVRLSGPAVDAVLARLVPVDMRVHACPPGRSVRTLLGHMNASITRTDEESFLILVFRSMAGTLVHELGEAMQSVAQIKTQSG